MWKNLVVKKYKEFSVKFLSWKIKKRKSNKLFTAKAICIQTKRKQLKFKRCIENLYGKVTINVHKL